MRSVARMHAIAPALIQPAVNPQNALLTPPAGTPTIDPSGATHLSGQPLADFANLLVPMAIPADATLVLVEPAAGTQDPALLELFAISPVPAPGDATLDLPTADSLQSLLDSWSVPSDPAGAGSVGDGAAEGQTLGADADLVAELMMAWMPAAPLTTSTVPSSETDSAPTTLSTTKPIAAPVTGQPMVLAVVIEPAATTGDVITPTSPWLTVAGAPTPNRPAQSVTASPLAEPAASSEEIDPILTLAPSALQPLADTSSVGQEVPPAVARSLAPAVGATTSAITQSQVAATTQTSSSIGLPSVEPTPAAGNSPDAFGMPSSATNDVLDAVLDPSALTRASSPAISAPAAPAATPLPTKPAAAVSPEPAALSVTAVSTPEPKAEPFDALLLKEPAQTARTESSTVVPSSPTTAPTQAASRTESPQPVRSEANPVERAVAHQVARAIVQHLPDGGTRMVMRLTPPELGTVRVEFITRDGIMSARLLAEDDGVRQALDRALPHIRAEVRGEHPTVDISVDRGEQRQAWSDGQQRQDRRDSQGAEHRERRDDDQPAFSIEGVTAASAAPQPLRAVPVLGGRASAAGVDALA